MLPLMLVITYGCGTNEDKDTDTGVYNSAYISGIAITEPERALALLDTAGQRGIMDGFELNSLRALVCHNGLSDDRKALDYALKAYGSPGARDNTRKFLRLLEMIAGLSYQNGDYPQSVRYCTEGISIAQDSLIRNSEANLVFYLGRNLFVLNREDEGFMQYAKSVEILDGESKKDRTYETADDYAYRLAMLIGAYKNYGRYDEAEALLPRYEEAVNRLETKERIPDGLVDMRRASGYAMAAQLYAIRGEEKKAREQYLKLCATDYAKTPDASQLIIPYLYQVGDYRGALRRLKEEKKFWQANTDTVSWSYIRNHLESELAVYEKLGDIREANRVLHTIQELNDTLRVRDRNEKALELAEIYKTQQQALQIERQSSSILIHRIIIISAALIIILCVTLIVRTVRHNRTISTKNRAMVKTIDELIGYKERMLELQEEVMHLRGTAPSATEQSKSAAIPGVATTPYESESAGDTPDDGAIEFTDGDRALFERMNFEVLSRRLFLDPDFSKNYLLAEFRIPAYKFSSIFKEYAGCSFSQYIHNCRLDYAVKLMRENPSWSLDAIARTVQMSKSSFYSQFKKKFGMNPADLRISEAPDTSDED